MQYSRALSVYYIKVYVNNISYASLFLLIYQLNQIVMYNRARNISYISIGILCSILAHNPIETRSAELTFSGNTLPVLEETPERNTGLDKIYILYDIRNVTLCYSSSNPSEVRVLRYSNLGGGFAEEISNIGRDSESVYITDPAGNMGYIIEDNDQRYYFWIVNYLPYRFDVKSVSQDPESDCDATLIDADGTGEPIHYFTINGQQRTLDREICVDYSTQEWNEDNNDFITVEQSKYFASLVNPLRITPPVYCSSSFRVTGDKFLRQWDWISEAESSVYSPVSVLVATEAIQDGKTPNDSDDSSENESKSASNEILNNENGLGGSAPATITFVAYTTEGVLHHEWQLTTDPNFDDIEYRFNQQTIDYTFNQEGTFYMRYVGSNYDGSCEAIGDVYTIHIGASELKCPNAFSPDGDGVNDEWKVSYRSLLNFKCWIFDRFGNQLFYFDDPSQGWDGKRNGKTVLPGVYYYVIQAEGADGKKYKKSGDINILRHITGSSSSSSGVSE